LPAVQNKLAALIALAKYPDGRAARDQLHDEMARLIADPKLRKAEYYAAFDHIDVFQSGLVASIGDTLEITERGWSLLHALGIGLNDPTRVGLASPLQSLNLIDELVGPEARQKIFDLGPESDDGEAVFASIDDAVLPARQSEAEFGVTPAAQDDPANQNTHAPEGDETPELSEAAHTSPEAPDFLIRKFGSGLGAPPRPQLFTLLGNSIQRSLHVWRRHLREEAAPERAAHANGNVERGLFALMSLLAIVGCAAAVVAFTEVKALKSELAVTQREMSSSRDRLAKLEQIQRTRVDSERPADQNVSPLRGPEPPLQLSREEIQLVRDYIKPAPIVGGPAEPIKVGDPVIGPTIPFPSPVTDKVPKLLGTTFTIRNGAIVVVRKDSRRADAVLGPN